MIAPAAIDLICGFEGYHKRLPDGRAAPYLCPAYVPSVGFGSIWRPDGTRVAMSDPPITQDEAMALMQLELTAKCEPAIGMLITTRLTPLMHGALVSFVYNVGSGALKGSNLRKAVNERRWTDITSEFAKWRIGGGRILPGLVRRRAAEAAMFMAGTRQATGEPDTVGRWVTTTTRSAA